MTEPKRKATRLDQVLPGVYCWSVEDDRIGGAQSTSYALVDSAGRVTLIDPLPIDEQLLKKLGSVEAIVLTAGNHQRAAWRFRKHFGAPVYAPENAYGLENKPDHTYSGGDLLPGGLSAFHTPGPVESMHALWLDRPVSVVFLSDLLVHDGNGTLSFVPSEYQDEPMRSRSSIERLLRDLPITALGPAHGPPLTQGGREALQRALADDPERSSAQPTP